MEKHPLQKLIESMEDVDLSLRSYSGRGMYGRECLAVVGDSFNHIVANLIGHSLLGEHGLTEDEKEDVVNVLSQMASDKMGRGIVVYFPGVFFVDDEEGPCPNQEWYDTSSELE